MTLAFLTAARAWFTGLPDGVRRLIYGAGLAIMAVLLIWCWLKAHDERVIEKHQSEQREQDVKALDMSAEERASDAMTNLINEKEREDAIKAAPEGGGVSPQDQALNCARLKMAGLTKGENYAKFCK